MNMKSGFDFKFGKPIIVENDKNGNNNGIFIKSVGQSQGQTKIGSESPRLEKEKKSDSETLIVFIKPPNTNTTTLPVYTPIQIQQQNNNNNVRVATAMIPPIVTNNNIKSIIETGQNIYKGNYNNQNQRPPVQVEQEVQVDLNLGQEKKREFQVQDVNDNRTTTTSTRVVPEEMKRTIPLQMDCYTQTSRFIHFPQRPFVQQEQVLIPKASREVGGIDKSNENLGALTSTSVPVPNLQNLPSSKSIPIPVQVVQKPPTYPILPPFDIYAYYQLLDGNQNEVRCPHVTESEDIRFGCQPRKKRRIDHKMSKSKGIDSEFKLKTDSTASAGYHSPLGENENEMYKSRKRRLNEESRRQIPIQVYNQEVVDLEKSKNVQSSRRDDGSDDENLNELVPTPSVQRKLFKFLQKLCLGGSSAADSSKGVKDHNHKYEDVNRNYNNSFTHLLQKSSNFFNRRSPAQLGSSWRMGHQVVRDKRQEINILPIVNNSMEMSISGLHRHEPRVNDSRKNAFDIVGIPLIRNQSHNNNLQRSKYPSKMKVERKVDPPPPENKSSSYETLTSQSDYETEVEKSEVIKTKKILNVEILPVPVSEKKYNRYESVNIDISKKKKPKPKHTRKSKDKKRASSCTILHSCGSDSAESVSVMDLELKKTMEEEDQIKVRKLPESWEKKVNVRGKSSRAATRKPPEPKNETEEEISLKSPWVPFVLQSKSKKSRTRNEKFDVNHSQQITFSFREYFNKLFCCQDGPKKKSQISPEPEPVGLSPVDIANNNTTKVKKKDENDVRERRRQWANSQRARNDDESNWVDIKCRTRVTTKSEGRLH